MYWLKIKQWWYKDEIDRQLALLHRYAVLLADTWHIYQVEKDHNGNNTPLRELTTQINGFFSSMNIQMAAYNSVLYSLKSYSLSDEQKQYADEICQLALINPYVFMKYTE